MFSLDFEFDLVLGLARLDWRYDSHRVLLSEPGHPESFSVVFDGIVMLELYFMRQNEDAGSLRSHLSNWRPLTGSGLVGLVGRLPLP